MNGGKVIYHFEGDTKDLDQKTKSIKSSIEGAFSGLGKTITGVFATAVTTATGLLTTLTKKAIDSYADLEQNIGGVETLFKNSANKVIKNANKAYKTAGLSANKYMETVTSFSASLLQSLEGDTEEAVLYADRAIIDMADNANKMGTSIEMIQNAYQGFAKQNYTMLDNLKLGYGGTKTEMERLIADASQMKEIQDKLNISVNEGDMSFGNIVNAISVMQEQMGIAGTTALEAKDTITGSINALKGAFDNFLNGSGGVKELVKSIVTVIGNLSKAFVKLVPQLAEGLRDLINELIPQIPDMIETLLPTLIDSILDLTEGIADAIPDIVTSLMNTFTEVIDRFAKRLPTLLPKIVNSIVNGLINLLKNVDGLVDAGLNLMMGLVDGIINSIPIIIEEAPVIIETLINALISNLPKLISMGPQIIIKLIEGITNNFDKLILFGPQILIALVKGIIGGLGEVFSSGPKIISSIIDGIGSALSKLLDIGAMITDKIWEGLKSIFTKARDWGAEFIERFCDGAKRTSGVIVTGFKGIAALIRSWLHFTRPDQGPLREYEKWMPDFMKGLAKTLGESSYILENQVEKVANQINDGLSMQKIYDNALDTVDDIGEIINGAFDLQPDITSIGSTYSPDTTVIVNNNMELDPLGQLVNNVKTFSGGAKNDYNWGASI